MTIPEDMPVTRIFRDFPTDFTSIEIIDATRPVLSNSGTKHWYAEYFYIENGLNIDGETVVKIAVLS